MSPEPIRQLLKKNIAFQGTGSALCTIVNAMSTAIFSLFIGFYFGWQLALLVGLFMPLLVLVGVLQVQMMSGYAKGNQVAVEQGGKVVT